MLSGAHLVGVDEDLRLPLQERGDGARLLLRLQVPVAVHVEEVVVGAAAGPAFEAVGGERMVLVEAAAHLAVEVDEAVAAVGVLQGVDDDDELVQPPLRLRPRSASR